MPKHRRWCLNESHFFDLNRPSNHLRLASVHHAQHIVKAHFLHIDLNSSSVSFVTSNSEV